MHPRAQALITALELSPHPEGGWFREIHRAAYAVRPADGRGERAAITVIWFLLVRGVSSRWHRVASDEVWQFVEGAPLDLSISAGEDAGATAVLLAPLDEGGRPVHVVPAREWQSARSTGDYTLVTCTVGPGFDFTDFEMER